MTKMGKLIMDLEPGKHFIGLWVYRQHGHRSRSPRWTVTFYDKQGEYWETPLEDSAVAALIAAKKILAGEKP